MWHEPQEGRPMNSAEKIIEQAIREDKGVDICLSVNTFLNGFVPVHVTFTKAKHNPFTSETKHHAESEIELVVDNRGKQKIAWMRDKPEKKFKVRSIYEDSGMYVSPRRLGYAFLDVGNVYECFDGNVFKSF